jgi:prepilin-type N-terminal cleavage/methylation domain-containing protein
MSGIKLRESPDNLPGAQRMNTPILSSETVEKRPAGRRSGFTLIETLAVLILIGILAGLAVKRFTDMRTAARERALDAAIAELNGREKLFWGDAMLASRGRPDDTVIFPLVGADPLGEAYGWDMGPSRTGSSELTFQGHPIAVVRTPSTEDTSGIWRAFEGILHTFGSLSDDFIIQDPAGIGNAWTFGPDGLFSRMDVRHGGAGGKEVRLLIPNPLASGDYSISLDAALGEWTFPATGYGVFFDAVPTANGEGVESGYVLQFDPGIGDGDVIIREWVPNGVGTIVARADSVDLPSKTGDPDWWTASHSVRIDSLASADNPDQRDLAVFIDDQEIISGFSYTPTSGETYTGFRSWGEYTSPTQIQNLEISAPPGP